MECIGCVVRTCYGRGKVVDFRPEQGLFVVQLAFGLLSCPSSAFTVLTSSTSTDTMTMMELNIAFEAMETMRIKNLELACHGKGVAYKEHQCATCLLQQQPRQPPKNPLDHVCHFVQDTMAATTAPLLSTLPSTSKSSLPCLVCGTPVCHSHRSSQNNRHPENKSSTKNTSLIVCHDCETLLCVDTLVHMLTTSDRQARRTHLSRLLNGYDRIRLLLSYSVQYMELTATSLRQSQVTYNRVGLGTCGAGVVASVLGIVSAATILTPAGPPLLLASFLFGSSATVAATGSDVLLQYFSEPHQLADTILALYGMGQKIVHVLQTFAETVERDEENQFLQQLYEHENEESSGSDSDESFLEETGAARLLYQHPSAVARTATRITSQWASQWAAATVDATVWLGRSSTSTTTASLTRWSLQSAKYLQFAGGALAAATLVLEAQGMNDTIQAILAGDPCEKADRLLLIQEQIMQQDGKQVCAEEEEATFPTTAMLEEQCTHCLETLERRQRAMTEEEVAKILLEHHAEILEQAQALAMQQQKMMPSLVHAEDDESESTTCTASSSSSSSLFPVVVQKQRQRRRLSLLQRIEIHKEKERTPPSSPVIVHSRKQMMAQ